MSAGDSVPYFPYYGTCSAIHPAQSSCWSVPPIRFFQVARWMLPIYSALHLIPAVLFKRETFMRNPLKVLLKAAIGTGRSSAFLGIFVIIYQCKFPFNSRSCGFTWFFLAMNCFKNQSHGFLSTLSPSSPLYPLVQKIPKPLIDLLVSKYSFFIPGLFSGLALFVEEVRQFFPLVILPLFKFFFSPRNDGDPSWPCTSYLKDWKVSGL